MKSICLLLLALGVSLRADPTPYNHTDPRLVYDASRSEDFSTETSVDAAKWKITAQTAAGLSADDPANVAIDTGSHTLVLAGHTLTVPVKGCYYSGGSLTTNRRYGYGYYEICAQMPSVVGWISSLTASGGASNSLKFVSFDSADTYTISQSCGYVSSYKPINGYPTNTYRYSTFDYDTSTASTSPASPKTALHYYGLEWTPRELIWYFDGAEVHRVNYPGPHSPIGLKLALAARSVSGGAPGDGAQLQITSVRYWIKNYDVTRLDSTIVAAPTDLVAHYPDSQLAFDHQVFDFDSSPSVLKYTTRPGDSSSSKPLASGDSSHPVDQYYSVADLARWDYNGTAPAADVFAWNPSMYPTSLLQADFGATPATNNALYSFVSDGTTSSGTATVDQIHDGQRWVWLGVHPFTPGSGYVKLAAQSWSPVLGIRAAAMQFRQLDYFYDDFSGSLTGWSSLGGTWAVAGGVLAQNSTSGTGLAQLVRSTAASWADCFVRAQVKFAGASPAKNVGLIGRYQTTSGDHYLLRLTPGVSGGPATLDLLRSNAGVFTTLATVTLDPAIDPTANFVDLHLFLRGNTLQALAQGELVLEYTDTSGSAITTAGQAGLRTYGGTAQFDAAGAGQ